MSTAPFVLNNLSPELYEFLSQFVNKDGILEIAPRYLNGKFKKYVNCVLGQPAVQQSAKKIGKDVIDVINAGNANLSKLISIASKASWISAGASILNLGVSAAGFAIVIQKLNEINGKLDNIMAQVQDIKQQIEDLKGFNNDYTISKEYENLQSNTCELLILASEGEIIEKDALNKLIKQCQSFLNSLFKIAKYIPLSDILDMAYSLLPLYTMLIKMLYENYLFSYKSGLHPLHEQWIDVIKNYDNEIFTENIRDSLFFEQNMPMTQIDETLTKHHTLNQQMIQEITNTVDLITLAGSQEKYQEIKEILDQAVKEKAYTELHPVLNMICPEEAELILDKTAVQVF